MADDIIIGDRINLPNGAWIDFEGANRIVIGIGKGRTAISLDRESVLVRCTPASQEECCAAAARIAIIAAGMPAGDNDYICRAKALAAGLFGPAYTSATMDQRWVWEDLCERELRRAAGVSVQ
jgi:hypothetical protein